MELLEAIILGVIQGLTEFLPVSSSGHLEIGSHLLGVNSSENLAFTMIVHAGTVMSTIVVFWKEIGALIRGVFKFEMNQETDFVLKIFVSLIPIMIVGFTIKDEVESLFGSGLLVVGVMLLLTSGLLWFSDRAKPRVNALTYKSAFVIGIAQALAVMPGLSRSGSTISAALLQGVKREEAARFSFLMVLIPILGMNFLEIVSGDLAGSSLSAGVLIGGFISSFVSGWLACRWMIKIVNKGKLYWFAIYCFIMGTIAIVSSYC